MNAIASSLKTLHGQWRGQWKIDRVWLALFLVLGVLFLISVEQGVSSTKFLLEAFVEVLPFLAIAVGVAAYAKASGADSLIADVFKGNQGRMIVIAALFGALSPFCSCGVIPIIASLLAMGVPLPAIMAFWLSSPIMNPEMFLITANQLGIEFAVAKTLSAVGFGLLGGGATWIMLRAGGLVNPLRPEAITGCGTSSCGTPSLGQVDVDWTPWKQADKRQVLWQESRGTFLFLGKWLAFAFLLESVMLSYVPAETIAGALGGGNSFAIPLAVLIGVPAYLNGFAAVPLMSSLMELGMQPGAALAFMTAGGVSCIPAAIAVYALVRRTVFLLYIALAGTGALLSGYLYQLYVWI